MTTNTYTGLNAMLNLYDSEGNMQLDKDKEAARAFFLEHVNPNTVFFHSLQEKMDYMVTNGYWDPVVLDKYTCEEIKRLFQFAYSMKYRFESFFGAYKFYTSYALKTYDGERYLERYEDRVCMVALTLCDNIPDAVDLVAEIMSGRFQPATPTFLNAGRGDAGELVSCFLLRVEDNMESIGKAIHSSLQLSKRGGGVALNLSNLRESGAPIKNVENASSGLIPVMKLLEDSFSYANQLGARQGAGAVYVSAHHPDILNVLDTKRENADEKIRIKTLSLGVVVPDITFELAKNDEPMYLFSPYSVEKKEGKAFGDLSVTENYRKWVDDPDIVKTKISARKFLQTLAQLQFESGYPYILFEDTANNANPISGKINMSNLCSEILQVNTPSELNEDGSFQWVGRDISCNLGSMNIAKAMENPSWIGHCVETSITALTSVSVNSSITSVPTVFNGNRLSRAVGLGQMNLHGFLAQNHIEYGSEEALDFVNVYFALVRYHALYTSMYLAREYGKFKGFDESDYADGTALKQYEEESFLPKTDKVKELFGDAIIPTTADWEELSMLIQRDGIANAYLLAVPPTGNISYVNGATPSIHPVTSAVEIRKEGKAGRVYYPAPGLSEETLPYYTDAYELGYKPLIDTYAVATKHTDQGLSCTLFFKDTATTRDVNLAQIYAWKKGLKTLYYARVRQTALEGTGVEECVSCTL